MKCLGLLRHWKTEHMIYVLESNERGKAITKKIVVEQLMWQNVVRALLADIMSLIFHEYRYQVEKY